ncbi:GIY-YIG nuclease family protein [Microbaculum marinum]|uniref:GIY-YIG nuclease family protein n=1 Tax=Microbaculum marinum TaxID=1764581 RepID=A0AAW9RQX8_9HYPH
MGSGYWVYILASKRNGTLYVGMTDNLGRRLWQHREGTAQAFTRRHGVKRLVHAERFEQLDDARLRERQLKRWRRAWKLELIEATNPGWDDLSDRLNA